MKVSVPCIFREKGSATVRTVLWYYTCKKKLQKESWIDKLMNQLSGSELSNKKKVPLPSAFKIFPQKFPTASNLHWTKKPRAPRSGCLDLRPFETSLGVQWPRQSAVALPPHPHGSAVRWLLKGSSEGRWVVEVSASDDDFVSCKMSLQNGVFFFGGGGAFLCACFFANLRGVPAQTHCQKRFRTVSRIDFVILARRRDPSACHRWDTHPWHRQNKFISHWRRWTILCGACVEKHKKW